MTLASFALHHRTGELVVRAEDGKEYRVAFIDGVVVGARSPLAADSVARIALTGHLITATNAPAVMKRIAASPDRDEVEVVVELTKLPVEHAVRLRRRVITQRAARTFSVDRGDYRFYDTITIPVMESIDVDICAAIYLGVHINLSEHRLAEDTRRIGSRFALHAKADLTRFGFTDVELPIIESLERGASLPELDARHRDIVPRTQQAVVYALVACGACDVVEQALPEPVVPERSTTITDLESRTKTTDWKPPSRAKTEVGSGVVRTKTITSSPAIPRTITPRRNTFAVRETIAAGIALIDARVDHYTLLGVERDARLDVIRSAYVGLACQLHRDKLPPLDADGARDAQRLFSAVNTAFGVICDPVRRAEYARELQGEQVSATKLEAPANDADAAFHRGLLALKREDLEEAIDELLRATELAPNDVDYAAMLAWARFCAAGDKHAIAPQVRKVLEKAIQKSPKPMMARFYLGRVERILGRVREALHHFREVIELEPGHADAATEIRMLEPRAANADRRHR